MVSDAMQPARPLNSPSLRSNQPLVIVVEPVVWRPLLKAPSRWEGPPRIAPNDNDVTRFRSVFRRFGSGMIPLWAYETP
jgi:hypothetical protein